MHGDSGGHDYDTVWQAEVPNFVQAHPKFRGVPMQSGRGGWAHVSLPSKQGLRGCLAPTNSYDFPITFGPLPIFTISLALLSLSIDKL